VQQALESAMQVAAIEIQNSELQFFCQNLKLVSGTGATLGGFAFKALKKTAGYKATVGRKTPPAQRANTLGVQAGANVEFRILAELLLTMAMSCHLTAVLCAALVSRL